MLALDESNEHDEITKEGNYTFCIDKDLLSQIKSVTVDFTYTGFSVTPEVAVAGGGGCSASGSGCGGCGH